MEKDKIYCYTGTGNCLASAKILAKELDMEVVLVRDELCCSTVKGNRCIIIFPVYAYCLPSTLKRFIETSTFEVNYMVVLSTFGTSAGGAYAEAIRLFKKRGQKVHLTTGVRAVENYVHMFGFEKEDKIKTINSVQYQDTLKLAEDIKQQKENKRILFRPISSFVAFMFRWAIKVFERSYKFTDRCNGCSICAKVCPAKAIEMRNNKPYIRKKTCDHCQACMQLCPSEAIKFGVVKPGGKRYKHTDVELSELIKR